MKKWRVESEDCKECLERKKQSGFGSEPCQLDGFSEENLLYRKENNKFVPYLFIGDGYECYDLKLAIEYEEEDI